MLRVKSTIVIALLVCLTALPVLAQDAAANTTAAPDSSGPTGITTLVILAGLGAIFTVGGLIYMREKRREVD